MSVKREPVNVALPAALPTVSTKASSVLSEAEQQKARGDAMKRHAEIRRAFAWPLHRIPLEKHFASTYIGERKGKLVLPRSYRSGSGEDIKFVRSDEDLNIVVHHWYDERVEPGKQHEAKSVNFVTKDDIVSRRHEYLGPDPRVAGYEVGRDGNIRIRWWDGFLQDQWVGKEKWDIEVVCDDSGNWVECVF